MLQRSAAIAAIREACTGLPITLAYLHGSYAADRADHESDLDVAVLADASLSQEQRCSLRIDLYQRLLELLPASDLPDLDVVILQDVSVLLRYNVVRGGVPVFLRSRADHIDFTLATERAYDDEAPYLDREAEITLNRILSRAA